MDKVGTKAHPYMPNSAGNARSEMLGALDIQNVEEIFEQIPETHRRKSPLQLPEQLASELDLKRHLLFQKLEPH